MLLLRKKLLARNTFSSLLYQITAIICGFIVPRLLLSHFGSEINGLTQSIAQFLHVIAFLEMGVGAVIESSLYKPLAEKNNIEISKVMASANKFFRSLAFILAVYVVLLIFVYPQISNQNFDFVFTATLILAICISSFAQYYFGIVNSLLLAADQHGYVNYLLQTGTIILNTIACVTLIHMDASIQMVKFATSVIFLLRPIILKLYVSRNYNINWDIEYQGEPIRQKWNGVAQHFAAIVLDSTGYIVLTVFSSLTNVSIYSMYMLVVNGAKQMFMSMTVGIQAIFGELWARNEKEKLIYFFSLVEWALHSFVTITFGSLLFVILPFISVYTKGVVDANYQQPLFAFFLVMAFASRCIRLPYNMMILAVGHFKETQSNYVVAALLNITVSIITVKLWGLVGVAMGSFVALLYQIIWMINYNSKNIIHWPIKNTAKQIAVDLCIVGISYFVTSWISLKELNYFDWFIMAFEIFVIVVMIWIGVNCLFYKDNLFLVKHHLFSRRKKI
ncbi:sugar isomerase [uncultured Succiniclasticum sp.]|uniref:lipopolysaccharide biosynthesis protein n=1 Tax=uncultured Succiniclasticum sp. TaxID=1500547 RepID=UPI00344E2A87